MKDIKPSSSKTTSTEDKTLTGKRKEPLPPSPITTKSNKLAILLSSSSSSSKTLVDAAFERMFGYSWGTTFDLASTNDSNEDNDNGNSSSSSIQQQMIQIFGPLRTARILNQRWDVIAPLISSSSSSSREDYKKDSVSLTTRLTTKTVATPTCTPISVYSSSIVNDPCKNYSSITRENKKIRLEEKDYKNIELPKHMMSCVVPPPSAIETTTANTVAAKSVQPTSMSMSMTTNNNNNSSNLDTVLEKIAGKKKMNTVEKSSNDWEGFKETDKTLQDELERTAQSKNAFLVKKDFLNRVDQRKFELEKEERDRERSRRTASSTK